MLAEKVCDLGLDRLGQQGTRPTTQDFSELILDVSWLNQLDDVIVRHGISLLRWRSGGVKHPHDMPPSRFAPSPTFGDSSFHFGRGPSRYHTSAAFAFCMERALSAANSPLLKLSSVHIYPQSP